MDDTYLTEKTKLYNKLINILPNFEDDIAIYVDVVMYHIDKETRKKFFENVNDSYANELKKILITQNQLRNSDAHPLGMLISNSIHSTNTQKILNVKHLGENTKNNLSTATPVVINDTILPKKMNNQTIFRLRVNNPQELEKQVKAEMESCEFKIIGKNSTNDHICEVVYQTGDTHNPAQATEKLFYFRFKELFEASDCVKHIIFFSNCKDLCSFEQDINIIYSNCFKFFYCIKYKCNDVDLMQDIITHLAPLQTYVMILCLQENFNTNPKKILPPIALLSAEKNTCQLKATLNETFATGAPKDQFLLGNGTSVGGLNKIDLQLDLKVPNTVFYTNRI